MVEGLKNPNVVLKIGFVNDKVRDRLDAYKKAFDVLILYDGNMDFPLQLIQDIVQRKSS